MAAIDKIYMTEKQGIQFLTWILDHNDECIKLTGRGMVNNFYKSEKGYIANYPEVIDWYLYNKFCTTSASLTSSTSDYENSMGTILQKIIFWP